MGGGVVGKCVSSENPKSELDLDLGFVNFTCLLIQLFFIFEYSYLTFLYFVPHISDFRKSLSTWENISKICALVECYKTIRKKSQCYFVTEDFNGIKHIACGCNKFEASK